MCYEIAAGRMTFPSIEQAAKELQLTCFEVIEFALNPEEKGVTFHKREDKNRLKDPVSHLIEQKHEVFLRRPIRLKPTKAIRLNYPPWGEMLLTPGRGFCSVVVDNKTVAIDMGRLIIPRPYRCSARRYHIEFAARAVGQEKEIWDGPSYIIHVWMLEEDHFRPTVEGDGLRDIFSNLVY